MIEVARLFGKHSSLILRGVNERLHKAACWFHWRGDRCDHMREINTPVNEVFSPRSNLLL